MMEDLDGLDDWVAIKGKPFLKPDCNVRYQFHVAWNDVEKAIAMTSLPHSRFASDTTADGWSCLLAINELQSVHEHLSLVYPTLYPALPKLPIQSHSIWAGTIII